ncbi:MAG: hypothetical protein ABI619_11105, partial [Betaproteobacteria bacterium]
MTALLSASEFAFERGNLFLPLFLEGIETQHIKKLTNAVKSEPAIVVVEWSTKVTLPESFVLFSWRGWTSGVYDIDQFPGLMFSRQERQCDPTTLRCLYRAVLKSNGSDHYSLVGTNIVDFGMKLLDVIHG